MIRGELQNIGARFPVVDGTVDGYAVNSAGFRCAEFDTFAHNSTVLYLGGIHVFGVGLADDEIWCAQVHQALYPEMNYLNCGTVFQTLQESLLYLLQATKQFNIHRVYLTHPDYERNGAWLDIEPDFRSHNTLSNHSDVNGETRRFYSELCLESIHRVCGDKLITSCAPSLLGSIGRVDVGTDGVHPGPLTHQRIAQYMIHKEDK